MLDRSSSYDPQLRGPEAPAMVTHNEEMVQETNGDLPQYVDRISVVREVILRKVKEGGLV